jgi:hypothetical protein
VSALNCHVPARIRIAGSPTQETWDALETALARHYARSIRRGLDAMGNARVAAARADARELHSPAREHPQGYLIPSYQGFGQPEPVAMDAGAAVAAPPSLSGEEAIEAIRRHYGGLEGAEGGRLGIYTRIGEGMLQLHVAVAGPDGKVRLQGYRLFVERGAEQMPARLEPGTYHMVLRAGLSGHLYRGGRVVSRWRNPENYDLSVNFLVPQEDGIEEVVVRGRGPRFFARLSGIVPLGPDEPAAGATRSYRAGIEIWREDEAGAFTLVPGLALIYASVTYEWTISRIEKGPAGEVRTPIRNATTDIAFLTHVWEKPGDYDVACTVGLKDRAASPVKAIEHLREKVLDPDIKLARELAQLEAAEEQLGASIWLTPQAAIAALEKQIEDAKADPAGNEALIQALEKLLADARHRLGDGLQRTASRLRAVFIERRTSQVMPLALYLAPLKVDLVDPVRPHRWRLVDLTYPAFYASFEGSGATVREAILAAFEAGRTSLRATYPPGEILASIDFPELATYGISPFSVTIETESWQRTAFEWLSFGAQVAGGLALTASLVFPPTSVAVGALVLASAVLAIGAGVGNIAARIQSGSFAWDAAAVADIVAIAASLTVIGGTVVRGAASGVRSAIQAGAEIEVAQASRLAQLMKAQRAMMYMGIGGDVSSGVLLSYDTYVQMRDIDAVIGAGARADYQRIYGAEEGARRYERERIARIIGILTRAALQGALILVSLRRGVQGIGEPAGAAGGAPALPAPPSPAIAAATTAEAYVAAVRADAASPAARSRNWDHVRFPRPPRGYRWQPGDPIDAPNLTGGYPDYDSTARPRYWRNRAEFEIRDRAGGASAHEPNSPDAVKRLSDAQLQTMRTSGLAPADPHFAGRTMELEHWGVPQRVRDWLIATGFSREEARRLTRVSDPNMLLEVAPLEHAFFDAEAQSFGRARADVEGGTFPGTIAADVRNTRPLAPMDDATIIRIVDTARTRHLDWNANRGSRQLRDHLRTEINLRNLQVTPP